MVKQQPQPKRRTDAFDAAISSISTELGKVSQAVREHLEDPNCEIDKISELQVRERALSESLAARRQQRALAAKFDMRDDFRREEASMRALEGDLVALLNSIAEDGAELDALYRRIGPINARMEAKRQQAWSMFIDLARYITRGDQTKHRYEGLVYSSQGRISTGEAAAPALLAAVKGAGIGITGVVDNSVLVALRSHRVETSETIEQALRAAHERVSRHLALAFQTKADEVAAVDFGGQPPEPQAPVVVDFSRPPQ